MCVVDIVESMTIPSVDPNTSVPRTPQLIRWYARRHIILFSTSAARNSVAAKEVSQAVTPSTSLQVTVAAAFAEWTHSSSLARPDMCLIGPPLLLEEGLI